MRKSTILTVGRRLRNLRKALSLSRRELEQKHGISANSVKAWEMGTAEIGTVRLMGYLKIFEQYSVKVSIDTLLQTNENYLDATYRQQNLTKPFDANFINSAAPLSAKYNKDVELICNIFKNEMSSLLYEKDTILKTLINNIPFQILLKDDTNTFLLLNDIAAASLGGIGDDFTGKNSYDLLPKIAKKYHEDDLKCLATNTTMNIVRLFESPYGPPELLNINKIPLIHPETNKRMILSISYTI